MPTNFSHEEEEELEQTSPDYSLQPSQNFILTKQSQEEKSSKKELSKGPCSLEKGVTQKSGILTGDEIIDCMSRPAQVNESLLNMIQFDP